MFDRRLPPSCCMRLVNGICMETDAYRFGCYQKINDYVYVYSRLIVAIGIGIAVLEVQRETKNYVNFFFE